MDRCFDIRPNIIEKNSRMGTLIICKYFSRYTERRIIRYCKYRPECPNCTLKSPTKNGGEPHLTKKTKIYGIITLRTKMRQNNGGIPKW